MLKQWWKARVRGFGPGRRSPLGWYVRITPSLGFAIPWTKGRRIRWARHHGLQLVELRGERWVVARQLFGRSSVKGEVYKRKLPLPSPANISSIT